MPIFSYALAPFWDDLVTSGTGHGIFTSTVGVAPNRIYNIEWRAMSYASNDDDNFEIQLYETPPPGLASQVVFVYGVVDDVGSATVGIMRGASQSTEFECNTSHLTTGMQLTFTLAPCPVPPTDTPAPSPTETSIPPTATATTAPTDTPGPSVTGTPNPSATNTPVFGTATPTETPCPLPFSDVHPTDYFYVPVQYLYCHGVISGYADNTFRPYNSTTRSQMVKIVVLGFGLPTYIPPGGDYTFADVKPDFPFFDVIETAAHDNIVSGYNCGGPGEPCDSQNRPYFRPYNNVTRGQLSKIDVVAAGWDLQNPPTGSFTDVLPNTAFYTFVETAYCHGIISGYDCGSPGEPCDPQNRPYFRQGNDATRGQISKIVYLSITGNSSCNIPTVTK